MPSRKKAKGKARRAAKTKAEEEGGQAPVEVAVGQRQEESVEAQLRRLVINGTVCRHGYPSLSDGDQKICRDFIVAFMTTFLSKNDLGGSLETAHKATMVEYADVYDFKMDAVFSMLLASGTQLLLGGDNGQAELFAMLASYFENYMAVAVGYRQTQATVSLTKTFELCGADGHTLVSYYKKRIPCGCLDETYKKVKPVKKLGLCFNPSCSKPNRKAERSKMFTCPRCGDANYCSVECQKIHWKEHKQFCDEDAKLDSNQTTLLSVEKWSRWYVARLLQWLLIVVIWAVLGVEFADAVVCFVSCGLMTDFSTSLDSFLCYHTLSGL